MAVAGRKVEVAFDPFFLDEIEVRLDGKSFKAVPLEIGENVGAAGNTVVDKIDKSESSRMLDALNRQNITNRTRRATAVSYRGMGVDTQ